MKLKPLIIEILGWAGTVLVIAAYALSSLGFLAAASLTYQLMNAFGAIGIIIVAYSKCVYQPVVLNVIWLAIALLAISKKF